MRFGNMLVIVRKEFSDLLGNWILLVVLGVYFVFSLFITVSLYHSVNGNLPPGAKLFTNNLGMLTLSSLFTMITSYGAILGVMIGCLSISNERETHALNTLITKPVYRDTIINGKLLGALAFVAFIVVITTMFFTSVFFVVFRGSFTMYFGDYLSRLPLVLLFSLLYIVVYLSISILISLLIKNQSFTMIASLIVIYLMQYVSDGRNASNIASLFQGDPMAFRNLMFSIESLFPPYSLWAVPAVLFNPSMNILDILQFIMPYVIKLLLYTVMACVLSYIVFLRRDIT